MQSLVTVQKRVKTDVLKYVVIYKAAFYINSQEQLLNITPNMLLVIPENLELAILNIYHNSLLN